MKERVTFRLLGSAVEYVKWLEAPVGEAPGRAKVTKVDQLVEATAPAHVFLQYLNERMALWVPHWAVEDHQLKVRGRYVAAVAKAPRGQRLEILLDWSEKLGLEPNNSATGAQYAKIGLIVAVCVYKAEAGDHSRVETVGGICEAAINDVPHTHAFLRKVLARYSKKSAEMGTKLTSVNVWSDGGPAHFKCAEGFAFCSHLVRELRELVGDDSATLGWHFMQSYHGKGPYDAEVSASALTGLKSY